MFKNQSEKNFSELSETFFKFAYVSEIHEWDNRSHLERIAKYMFLVARSMGFSQEESTQLSLASQLHDVGKIMTPKELLKKTGNLLPGDWKTVEAHTTQGAKILESQSSHLLQIASTIALTHHERWDGSGYPQHLKNQEIPLSGRICAVIDVFDALTTQRSYKVTISDEEAFRLLKDNSGVLFDPEVMKAFEKEFLEIRKIKKVFD